MLAGLFGEEDSELVPFDFEQTVLPSVPPPRGETHLAGIWNQGSTCFLNCSLQVLAFIPEFRDRIMKVKSYQSPGQGNLGAIPLQLQKLFAKLMLEQQQAVSTKPVTRSFGWDNQKIQQEDAQELLQLLFEAIQTSLVYTTDTEMINDLFSVTTVRKIKCTKCLTARSLEDKELNLFVQVAHFSRGLEQSLSCSYRTTEMMDGNNLYECNACGTMTEAEMSAKLKDLSPVIMFVLKRFVVQPDTLRNMKVQDRFPFPMELDMSPYTVPGEGDSSLLYELMAIAVHRGGAYAGHYFSYVRDIDDLGHWKMQARKRTGSAGFRPTHGSDMCPFQLVTKFLSVHPEGTMNLSQLASGFVREGVKWSTYFKMNYGPFDLFITNNPDHFIMQDGKVSLNKDRPLNTAEYFPWETNVETEHAGIDSGYNSGIGSCEGSTSPQSNDDTDEMEVPPPEGHRWYCFNDHSVTALHENDIKKTFAGNECAYMLFYRRKDLSRPADAKSNPAYCVPKDLIDEVELLNREHEAKREEYARKKEEQEKKKQEVQIEIRYPSQYTMEAGMLKTDLKEPIRVTRNCQETLGDLREDVLLFGTGMFEDTELHMHRMKCWNGKSHLYEELKDLDKTLQELSLENGSIIFAWNGCEVGGQPVPTGAESEPITVKLQFKSSNESITHNFPKNTTVKRFRGQVAQLSGMHVDFFKIFFPGKRNSDHIDSNSTLESISVQDGCVVFLETRDSVFSSTDAEGVRENMHTAERFCVQIQDRCTQQAHLSDANELDLEIEGSMTVEEVRELLMAVYEIGNCPSVLRESRPGVGLMPPYQPEQTVAEAGITANTNLVLEPTQILVKFKVMPPPSPELSGDMEIMMNTTDSVADCVYTMATSIGLTDPSDWHICRTDFLGDKLRDGVLDDLTLPLQQCNVQPGDLLILEEGRLPSKGCVILNTWLYPTTPKLMSMQNYANGLNSCSSEGVLCEPKFLGRFEEKLDAPLENILHFMRERLISKGYNLDTSQLRISVIEGKCGRLRRVVRGHKNTLRRLKVDGKNALGVQIVDQADMDPHKEQLILKVQMRNPNDRTYHPAQELAWDTRLGSSASSLRAQIADRLKLPDNCVVIAKHFPDIFSWKILKDSSEKQPQQFGNQHRKGMKPHTTQQTNIRHKPFCVGDGDIIGVIKLDAEVFASVGIDRIPSLSPDDFATVEDDCGKEKMLQLQKERQEHKNVSFFDSLSARRPVAPMKIYVNHLM